MERRCVRPGAITSVENQEGAESPAAAQSLGEEPLEDRPFPEEHRSQVAAGDHRRGIPYSRASQRVV